MKCAKMFSSMLISGFLASGAALLLAGCNPKVKIGSDTGSDSMSAKPANEAKSTNGTPASGPVSCDLKLVLKEVGMFTDGSQQILTLSNQDLTASTPNKVATARATLGQITGKWYFEVHIDQRLPDSQGGVSWAQHVGVAVDEFIAMKPDLQYLGAVYETSWGISSSMDNFPRNQVGDFETGDLVGVALDLDGGRIYFSKNGVWLNGDPGAGTDGAIVLALPGTSAYYPFVGVSEGDQLTVNFGKSTFANSVPAGFLPYAQNFVADQAGNCLNPVPLSRPADPAPMTASCSNFDSYGAGSAGGTELHIIGVDEASGGQINVRVTRQGPLVLALSSFASVQWNVTADPGAKIERIVMSGDDLSSVSAPQGIPVDTFIGYQFYGYAWPAAPGASKTQHMIEGFEEKTGLTMTAFGGCQTGGSFTVTD
jgi:hypothetical protein